MKKTIILLLFVFCMSNANSQQMQFDWISQAGGPNWDIVTDMVEMPDGKIAVVGAFYGSIFFSGDTLTSNGSRDVFLAIYKKDGTLDKAVSFGGAGYDYAKKITLSAKTGLSIPIQFNQEIQINGTYLKGNRLNNLLIGQFDKDLKLTDHTIISSSSNFDLTSIKTAINGETYLSGWFTDTLTVDKKDYISKDGEDIFFGKISKSKLNWLKLYHGEGNDRISSMAVNGEGGNYMTGTTEKGNFDGMKTSPVIAKGMNHLFISQLNETGKEDNIIFPIHGYDIKPIQILKDSTCLWVLANFQYEVYINGQELASNGKTDVLLFKYNTEDHSLNYCQLGGLGKEDATGLVKSGDYIMITGSFTGKLDFAGTKIIAGKHGSNVFVASVNNDCQAVNITQMKGDGGNFPCSAFTSGAGVYVAGEFKGEMKADEMVLTSSGKEDVFLARIANCSALKPLDISINNINKATSNPSWELDAGEGYINYNWDDSTSISRYYIVYESGTYQLITTDTLGCKCSGQATISKTKSAKIGQEPEVEHEFRLYPTVTSSLVYWEPASEWGNSTAVVRIIDEIGQAFYFREIKDISHTQYQIDLSGMPAGVYVIDISGDGFHEVSKVIVKK